MKTEEKKLSESLVIKLNGCIGKVFIILVALMGYFNAQGQNPNRPITISGSKFTHSLIEKWVSEYKKENPLVQFKLIGKKGEGDQSDISVIAHQPQKSELGDDKQIVFVNKYALLPVTGRSNKYLNDIKRRGLDKKELVKLFFQEAMPDENPEEKIDKAAHNPVNIYSRESQASSSIAFASYFGLQSSDIKGKKISGDDIYLISSIKNDSTGITFNNLGYIYDLQTRRVKDGIVILPLAIDAQANASINNNVDEALKTFENVTFETIPVEKVGFVIHKEGDNKETRAFTKWVVSEGQKFNHEFGFLNLDKKLQADEGEKLSDKLLTAK